jgi:hypothetical protein
MANEFIHIDPGAILTKAEYELITGHQFNSQATGDILYASTSTQLSRLGIGSNTNVLEITGGVPAWVATSGTGSVARVTSATFVTPALGTPSALVGTNISGTASSLTAGTVTTNANLTGHVTSSGNAAVLGSFTSAQLATALTNETGSGLAVFGTSPTLVTPALGTPSALVATNASGTASSLTAGNVSTNANLTGPVTSTGNATAIADKALAIAKLADGTDGELITWNASGVIAAVAVGTDTHVLTSNGAGAAPTFQSAAGGPSQAVQSAIEAETNQDTYIPPDLLKYSPGVAKAWLFTTYSGGTPQITLGHRISSLGDEGTGHIQVNFSTNFSSAAYAAVVTTDGNDSIERCAYTETTHAVGAIDYFQVNITDDSNVDGASSIICFGDYA